MITDEQRLKLINEVVSGGGGFEADLIALNNKATEKEKLFAEIIVRIYCITHPRFSTCEHPNWERETEEEINKLNN